MPGQRNTATAALARDVDNYHSLAKVPPEAMVNIRNDMYLVSEALRFVDKSPTVAHADSNRQILTDYKKQLY